MNGMGIKTVFFFSLSGGSMTRGVVPASPRHLHYQLHPFFFFFSVCVQPMNGEAFALSTSFLKKLVFCTVFISLPHSGGMRCYHFRIAFPCLSGLIPCAFSIRKYMKNYYRNHVLYEISKKNAQIYAKFGINGAPGGVDIDRSPTGR